MEALFLCMEGRVLAYGHGNEYKYSDIGKKNGWGKRKVAFYPSTIVGPLYFVD